MAKKTKTIKVIPGPPFAGHPGSSRPPRKGCCSMGAAFGAARRGRWRLAARYVRMTPHFIAGHFA